MKFRVLIEGKNFHVVFDALAPRKHGFYATAHVEAETEEEAEKLALEYLRAKDDLRSAVQNNGNDRPRLKTEEIARIDAWPTNVSRPLAGLAWYEE